jgi:DNA modification methylase
MSTLQPTQISTGLSYRMKIEYWALDRIKPYERNARKIPQAAIDKVATSLQEYGWQQPIVVDAQGVIIVGHVRRLAALQLGWAEAPIHVATNLTADQVKAYRLADNRSHEEAKWDFKLLALELADLEGACFDLSKTTFAAPELARMLPRSQDPDFVAALIEKSEELLKKWKVERGQLWTIGPHRLVCGSCVNPVDVQAAVGELKPLLLITDPPYGVELDMEWRDRAGSNGIAKASKSYMKVGILKGGGHMSGDTRADWSEAFALVPSLEIAYVWHATSGTIEVATGLERIGFALRQQIIWVKPIAAMSRQAYHWKHEPCWYAVKKGKPARWVGGHNQTTVWEAASPKQIMSGSREDKLDHPTQKPIELMRMPMINHGREGDVVYEPFGGSGTTMAAAELSKKICCAIEIEPRYCAIILERMASLGLEPKNAKPAPATKRERARGGAK